MTKEKIYCSVVARETEEPLQGTAAHAECHVFVPMQKAKWGNKVEESPEPIPAIAEAASAVERASVRFNLWNAGQGHWAFAYAQSGMAVGTVTKPGDVGDLVEKCLSAPEENPPTTMYVCTHAKRDKCCGKFGAPFAKALRDADLVQRGAIAIQDCAHLGGHRFAATCVVMPLGHAYGWLEPEDASTLLEHVEAGTIWLEKYRGNAFLPPALQLAEIGLMTAAGTSIQPTDVLIAGNAETLGADEFEVTGTIDGKERSSLVSIAEVGLSTGKSCDKMDTSKERTALQIASAGLT